MPSSEQETRNRRSVALRYLQHALLEPGLPNYLGARLAATGLTDSKTGGDEAWEPNAGAIKAFFSGNEARNTGPTFVVHIDPNKPGAKFFVNDLLLYPSPDCANAVSSWLSPLIEAGTCSKATKTVLADYLTAVSSGEIDVAIATGAKLTDCFDDDWAWQLTGLRYSRIAEDGPGIQEQVRRLLMLPQERSDIVNVLTQAYQSAFGNIRETPRVLPSLGSSVISEELLKFGHLPWRAEIGLTAALARTKIEADEVTSLSSSVQNIIDAVGPAYWHQLWQAVIANKELKANPSLVVSVTDAVQTLCNPTKDTDMGRRAAIYLSLTRIFFFRLETQLRGIVPIGTMWCASKLAADLENALGGFFEKGFEPALNFFEEIAEQERFTWSVCSLDGDPSAYRDIFATKNTIWPLAIEAIPEGVPIDSSTIPDAARARYLSIVRGNALLFTSKPAPDSDEQLPVLDLLSRNRLSEWLVHLAEPELTTNVRAAEQAIAKYKDQAALLDAIRALPDLEKNDGVIVLLNLVSRFRGRSLLVKDLLGVIGTVEWVDNVLTRIDQQTLDLLWSALTSCPAQGQRDDAIRLAHWGAYVFKYGKLTNEALKGVAFTTVLIAMKTGAYSAIARLNATPNDTSNYDAQSDIEEVLSSLEQQTPLWTRGRVRAARVALLPHSP